jgi:hypothetical protein
MNGEVVAACVNNFMDVRINFDKERLISSYGDILMKNYMCMLGNATELTLGNDGVLQEYWGRGRCKCK